MEEGSISEERSGDGRQGKGRAIRVGQKGRQV